jgi:hypothetical protein
LGNNGMGSGLAIKHFLTDDAEIVLRYWARRQMVFSDSLLTCCSNYYSTSTKVSNPSTELPPACIRNLPGSTP